MIEPGLNALDHLATIATAFVAVVVSSNYYYWRCQRRIALEEYLRDSKNAAGAQLSHTVVHLRAQLGMSESEIHEAAFQSKVIEPTTRVEAGRAVEVLFRYDG